MRSGVRTPSGPLLRIKLGRFGAAFFVFWDSSCHWLPPNGEQVMDSDSEVPFINNDDGSAIRSLMEHRRRQRQHAVMPSEQGTPAPLIEPASTLSPSTITGPDVHRD